MRLAGKVALISGAARGMGAVEARLFAREGARVILGDILEAEGKQVEADIRAAGGEAVFVRLDVTREADWQQAVATAEGRFAQAPVRRRGSEAAAQPRSVRAAPRLAATLILVHTSPG